MSDFSISDAASWWESLADAERDEYRAIEPNNPLTAEQVRSMASAGIIVAGAKWETEPGYTFTMPERVADFIEQRDAS